MRRLLVLALAGCASGGGTGTPAGSISAPPRVLLVDEQGRVYRTSDTRADAEQQLAPGTRQQAVQALVGVYEELGISVNTIDWNSGLVGVRSFAAPRRIGGTPIGRYMDCGADHVGEPRANSYAVQLNVESVATQRGLDSVLLSTVASGTARQQGVSSDPLTCVTTGVLEKRLNVLATVRLAGVK